MKGRKLRLELSTVSAIAVAALATGLTGAGANAQSAPQPPGAIEEIIVTAQKRAQNLQEVPAAVSVLTTNDIESRPAVNIEGLQQLVPTLNFRKGGTSLNSSLFLRGVGTINFSIAAEPSVAFVLDGVVMARAGEAFGDLYDLERIEVLRGPQGTLFGKNASAGVVNVVSRKPGDKFGGSVEVSAFEGNEYKSRLAVDMPLSPKVRTRVTAFAGTYDGNVTNVSTGDKINGYDRYGIRGIMEIEPSEKLTVTLIADYRKADDDCCGELLGTAPTGANAAALTSLLAGAPFLGDETRNVRHNLVTQTQEEAWGGSAQLDYDVGPVVLTSITAYRGWDNTEIREGDWLDRPAAYVGNAFNQLHDVGPQESSTFSQEFRIASPAGERLEYVAGLYYYYADADRAFRRDVTSCTASTLPIDATGQRPCQPGASTFVTAFSQATFGSEIENMAVFGQGTYRLTDRLSLIGGLRFTRDDLSFYHNRIPSPVALPGLRTDTSGYTGSTSDDDLSGRAGLQFQATDDIMAYGTYSKGYKGPAYNVFFNQTPTQTNVIPAETADAYEVGAKTTWLDGRIILNIAAFYAEYDNFQANAFENVGGVVISRLTNAGEISTGGLELDWLIRATDGFTISGGLAYTDAQIERFRDAAGNLSTAREGERLPLAPEWKGTVGVDYEWQPAGMPFNVLLNGRYSYTDSQYSSLGAFANELIDSYSVVDASVGFTDKEETVKLTFFVNNLFDESYTSLITPGGPGGSLRYLIPREADRYYGASFKVNF